MPRIYLSYASADADYAEQLARDLERAGVEIAREKAPTERSAEETQVAADDIEMTMRASDLVVLLLSPAAMASPWVLRESATARDLERGAGVRLTLVVIEPVDVSGALGARGADIFSLPNTIDAIGRSPADVADALRELLATDATGAGDERARGITLPRTDRNEGAVDAAEHEAPSPEPLSHAGSPPPAPAPGTPPWPSEQAIPPLPSSQPPASPPSAPTPFDELPARGADTGTLVGAPAPSRALAGRRAVTEALQFCAYHANTLPVETWNTLLVYTTVDATLAAAPADATTFTELGSAPRISTGQSARAVAQGAELIVEPHMEGVTFSPPSDTFIWRGGWHRSLFRFQAAAALADLEQPGWVDIYAGPMVPIARIDLAFAFTPSRPALAVRPPAGRTVTSNPHDTVFISYSHRDREAFNQACDEYARFGIQIYTDEHLEAGADYERDLGRMIASARVFHLLWSPTSASSAECRKEWMAAMQREPSERFIKPWFWRQPLIPPPPEFAQHHISFRFQRLRRRLLRPETWF